MKLYAPYRYKLPVIGKISRKDKVKYSLVKPKKKRKQRKYDSRIPKKYKLYIKSVFWIKRRNEFYQKYGRACVICGSCSFIDLHHIVYGSFGFEKDENLVALCRDHHTLFHTRVGVKGNMTKETLAFIEEERQLLEAKPFLQHL